MKFINSAKKNRAFKAIHVLMGIGIVILITGLIFMLGDPREQAKKLRNSQRKSDVQELIDLLEIYAADNGAKIPEKISGAETIIGSREGQINICAELIPKYTSALPFDKNSSGAYFKNCEDYSLGYTIKKDSNNKIVIKAPAVD